MKRLIALVLVACSGGEATQALTPSSGGEPTATPSAGRAGSSKGGETTVDGGRASGGASTTGGETIASAGETAAGAPPESGGAAQGGEAPLGGTSSAGSSGSSVGGTTAGAGGSSGSSGSGGSGGSSTCARAAQMVWHSNGISYHCDNQCNLSVAQYANIEGMSCANEVTCMPDCYKSTPASCGPADVWQVEGASCVCGSCTRAAAGCKVGNQCLISNDGVTCKEAC